jgi:hypothetical protein
MMCTPNELQYIKKWVIRNFADDVSVESAYRMDDEESTAYLTNVKVASWNGPDQDEATIISIVVPGENV